MKTLKSKDLNCSKNEVDEYIYNSFYFQPFACRRLLGAVAWRQTSGNRDTNDRYTSHIWADIRGGIRQSIINP